MTRLPRKVIVVGGGLAGLAAAEAASRQGCQVTLLEARRGLGGRAGSFLDPRTDQWVDHCQHVALGCCVAWGDFCQRLDLNDCFQRDRRLHFISREGKQFDFVASRWLPAPLHLLPGLMRLGFLSVVERLGIARAMRCLEALPPEPADNEPTVLAWLEQQGQSAATIARYWSPVLVSALSESLERISLSAARQVFVEGFLSSRWAYELVLPCRPLAEVYGRAAAALGGRQAKVETGALVRDVAVDDRQAVVQLADGSRREADAVIVAVPWWQVKRMVPTLLARLPELAGIDQLQPASITALHLWFDRPIMALPHAVLLERTAQWLFRHPQAESADGSHYYQAVISASHAFMEGGRDAVIARVCDELAAIWPAAAQARRLHARLVTQPQAVFSVGPGAWRWRPAQRSTLPRLYWAGDWTATGWPATMEGAVRSGYLAVDALVADQ